MVGREGDRAGVRTRTGAGRFHLDDGHGRGFGAGLVDRDVGLVDDPGDDRRIVLDQFRVRAGGKAHLAQQVFHFHRVFRLEAGEAQDDAAGFARPRQPVGFRQGGQGVVLLRQIDRQDELPVPVGQGNGLAEVVLAIGGIHRLVHHAHLRGAAGEVPEFLVPGGRLVEGGGPVRVEEDGVHDVHDGGRIDILEDVLDPPVGVLLAPVVDILHHGLCVREGHGLHQRVVIGFDGRFERGFQGVLVIDQHPVREGQGDAGVHLRQRLDELGAELVDGVRPFVAEDGGQLGRGFRIGAVPQHPQRVLDAERGEDDALLFAVVPDLLREFPGELVAGLDEGLFGPGQGDAVDLVGGLREGREPGFGILDAGGLVAGKGEGQQGGGPAEDIHSTHDRILLPFKSGNPGNLASKS